MVDHLTVTLPFHDHCPQSEFVVFNAVVNTCFILDIFATFRTMIMVEGLYVRNPHTIARAYIRSPWFALDVLAALPVSLILTAVGYSGSLARVNQLSRAFRLFKLNFVMRRIEEHMQINPAVVRIFKLFAMLMLMWHWIGCIWWYVSDVELNDYKVELNDWHPRAFILEADYNKKCARHVAPCNAVYSHVSHRTVVLARSHAPASHPPPLLHPYRYAHAFFWATMVTSGIGYDIVPFTTLEAWVTTVFSVLGVASYVVLVGMVTSALANIDKAAQARREKLESINAYMRYKRVPHKLRKRMNDYYGYLYSCLQAPPSPHPSPCAYAPQRAYPELAAHNQPHWLAWCDTNPTSTGLALLCAVTHRYAPSHLVGA